MDGLGGILAAVTGVSIFAGLVVGVLKWSVRAGATTAVLTPFIIAAGFTGWALLFPLEYGHVLWAHGLIVWNYLGPFAVMIALIVVLICLVTLGSTFLNKQYGRFALLLGGLSALGAFAIYENSTLQSQAGKQSSTAWGAIPVTNLDVIKRFEASKTENGPYVVGLTGETRKDFMETGARECQVKQKAKNAGIPDALLIEYCSCVISRLADVLSPDELRFMFGPVPTEVQKKVFTTDTACKAALASSHATPAAQVPTLQRR